MLYYQSPFPTNHLWNYFIYFRLNSYIRSWQSVLVDGEASSTLSLCVHGRLGRRWLLRGEALGTVTAVLSTHCLCLSLFFFLSHLRGRRSVRVLNLGMSAACKQTQRRTAESPRFAQFQLPILACYWNIKTTQTTCEAKVANDVSSSSTKIIMEVDTGIWLVTFELCCLCVYLQRFTRNDSEWWFPIEHIPDLKASFPFNPNVHL